MAGTVYLLAPDADRAIGGVRQIYQLTDALVAAGIDASVVHATPGFRCSWFASRTPVVDAGSVVAGAGDLVVVPEIWLARVPTLAPGVAKVILNQNAYKTFTRGVSAATRPPSTRTPTWSRRWSPRPTTPSSTGTPSVTCR